MNEEEKKALKYFYNLRATIDESNMLFDEDVNVKCGKETMIQITTILNLINKLQKENEEKTIILLSGAEKVKKLETEKEELMKLMVHKNRYTKKIEEDLFENASNYVIPKQKLKDKIEDLNKVHNAEELEDILWRKNYTITELVQYVLQELLEESEGSKDGEN